MWKEKTPSVIKVAKMKVGENTFVYEFDDEKFASQMVQIRPVILKIVTIPAGAGLSVDGSPIGLAPRTLDSLPLGNTKFQQIGRASMARVSTSF
ncbi:MAG: hypothetical protein GY822_31610 [Deltaproteobacteria bacterium]|nr:hypothetical protein [Deltaproteobacteria bacterium]